ncbi:MAG: Xaa-Pro peptidase family protein [Thermodesulfobacteriota bacterium]
MAPYPDPSPPLEELGRRWSRLQALMAEQGLDGILFLQNADLIYACGSTQPEAVFLPGDGTPLVLARPPLDRTAAELAWTSVEFMPRRDGLGERLKDHARGKLDVLGLELDVLPAAMFQRLAEESLSGLELVDASWCVAQARAVKTEFELSLMGISALELDFLFRSVPDLLSQGVTELELDGRLMALARSRGHQGIIRGRGFNMELFLGHVLSGENGLVTSKVASPTGGAGIIPGFSQGAGPRRIRAGDLVSVDICGTYGGYITDQARLFIIGPVPTLVQETYDRLLNLIEDLKTWLRPGMACGRIYDQAFRLAEGQGLTEGFMDPGGAVCPFIGHGLGLELDEWPALAKGSNAVLAAGMTLALEPRVFLPGVGVIGLEDTYLVTEDGPLALTLTDRRIGEAMVP